MAKKGTILLVFAVFLFAQIAIAANFTATFSPVDSDVLPNEAAEFDLLVKSDSPKITYYSVYSNDVLWDLSTEPTSAKNNLKVYPFKEASVKVYLTPSKQLALGTNYGIPIVIKSLSTGDTVIGTVKVFLKSPAGYKGTYAPAVRTEVNMQSKVNPSEDLKIKVELLNQNNLNITELKVVLRSDLIDKSYETTLGPLEKKSLDFTIRLDPMQEPRKDVIYVQVTANDVEFEPKLVSYEVAEYGSIKEEKKTELGLMKSVNKIIVSNEGNARRMYAVKVSLPFYRRWFAFTEPDAVVKDIDGKTYLVWELTLDKNSSQTVAYTVSYRIILWTIIAVIIIVSLYYAFRSPVVLRKKVRVVMRKEGGISEMVVQLSLRNRSKSHASQLKAVDKVPHLVDFVREAKPGTIQPSKILRHEKKGTILEWDIGSLEPAEERIISYRVKAKLVILGQMSLPLAVARYHMANEEKARATSSNRISMFAE